MSDELSPPITIRPFEPADQKAARWLILRGLGEHFGAIDERINTDLEDIASTYHDALFLLACDGDAVVGTGALAPQSDGSARIVRMSSAASHRRRGIGSAIIERLLEHARSHGCGRVTLATNDDWDDANGFYRALGFVEIGRRDGDIAYELSM